jgi:hypothetical protein
MSTRVNDLEDEFRLPMEDEASDDEKYYQSNVLSNFDHLSTLGGEQSISSEIDNKEKSLSYLRQTNTWKWGYCCSSITNLLLVSLFIFFFIRYLFLQTPFIRISSIKMLNPPLEFKLNLQVEIEIYNPNIVRLETDHINLIFSVNSDKSDNNPISFIYERQPLTSRNRTFIAPLSTQTIILDKTIVIELRAEM